MSENISLFIDNGFKTESAYQCKRVSESDKLSSKRYSAVLAELDQIGYEKLGHMDRDMSNLTLMLWWAPFLNLDRSYF